MCIVQYVYMCTCEQTYTSDVIVMYQTVTERKVFENRFYCMLLIRESRTCAVLHEG